MTITDNLPSELLDARTVEYLRTETFGHVIDGEVVASTSDRVIPVFNPSSGQQIAEVADASDADVDRAVLSARRAFDDGRWRHLDPAEKERRLRRLAVLHAEHGAILSDLDVLDAGIVKQWAGFLLAHGVNSIDYYAGWPTKLQGTIPATTRDVAAYVLREPVGVCATITPWNGPSAVVGRVAAALACGNSVIIKPAEQTPLAAVLIGQLCIEAGIPPGVVNILQGTGATAGAGLVAHPGVDKISFTGSVETGKRIQRSAVDTMKRVTMELGGKSPHIVFGDADLDKAVPAIQQAVWNNSGQVCTAGSRVLVQRSIYDQVVAAVVERSKDLRVGSAFENVDLGPLVSAQQMDTVERYVEGALAEGAELVLGGGRTQDNGGAYLFNPTVFADVATDMTIAREEIFGPVMSIIPFEAEDDAFRIANDTMFGLSAGVWTQNLARAHRAARAIQAGTVWVNTYQRVQHSVPYGGIKQSGYGRHLGEDSLEPYLATKSVWMQVD
ncbi:aldehyde dehydrogenase family protein [Georgenia ruanii]|uniref:Aldehyde dehydrogenase family protein n=1 Tax=Georgenia ruanii TaxID=348442 RepID=A0A7J9UXX2_9MICO|nr:aldehyde dehydrogenase family protein [Georgenia ruanii]MPV88534.1 aldehyde dehydrogenase family protein [Georgenia ruanii]